MSASLGSGGRLKPGDVVCLNSGGPEMTVSDVIGQTVTCVWFEELLSACSVKRRRMWGELRTRMIQSSSVRFVR